MPDLRISRLLELIEYARQTALMSEGLRFSVEDYGVFHLFENNVETLPGMTIQPACEEGDEIWLSVQRLRETPPPAVIDKLLTPWIEALDNPRTKPSLRNAVRSRNLIEKLEATDGQLFDRVELESYQNKDLVLQAFREYVDGDWLSWSKSEQPIRESIGIYGKLFTLKQQLEGGIVDAPVELVWGTGVATWRLQGKTIRLPLITKAVELSLNEKTMAIELRPRDMEPQIELRIYSDSDNPNVRSVREKAEDFWANSTEEFSPFESETFEPILKQAATLLDPKGVYIPDEEDQANSGNVPAAEDFLQVTDTWVIFARPRGASIFVQDLERFKVALKSMDNGAAIPNALAAIVTDPSNEVAPVQLPSFRGLSSVGSGDSASRDLFFPMPFNDEQVRIAQLLEVSDGIVVQGPPGTGKSHTIANIICHYLAEGKRVLVTSMRDPALSVLQDKLPEDIRPLVVSLLTSEREGMKQFQFAIERIASIAQSADKQGLERSIREEEEIIERLHSNIALCDRRIAEWARKNLTAIDLDGEMIDPAAAAEEVVANVDDAGWLEDKLGITPNFTPIFDDGDIVALREARSKVAADLGCIDCTLPSNDSLPSIREALETHKLLKELNGLETEIDDGALPALFRDDDEGIAAARVILSKLDARDELISQISGEGRTWTEVLLSAMRKGSLTQELRILGSVGDEIDSLTAADGQFLSRPISLPDGFEENSELYDAVTNLADGGRPFGLLGIVGKSTEKGLLASVRIVTSPASDSSDWQYVREYLDHLGSVKDLLVRWNAVTGKIDLPTYKTEASSIEQARNDYQLVKQLRKLAQLEGILADEIKMLVPGWSNSANPISSGPGSAEARRILESHVRRFSLKRAEETRTTLLTLLRGYTGEIVAKIRKFVQGSLGSDELFDDGFAESWNRLIEELTRLNNLRTDFDLINQVCSTIEESGAPIWSRKLKQEPSAGAVDQLLPNSWRQIWRLRRLSCFLDEIDARNDLKIQSEVRRQNEVSLGQTYRTTIRNRTFLRLLENATPSVKSALEAFRTAISKIGRGTGKRAVRYRRDARNAASLANPAIPCWIMPHYRVSESLPPDLGAFDLVVIDEASQSDLTALPALLRAKKVLVVGDERQVSPEGVGLAEDRITRLMEEHLRSQVPIFKPLMTPERSIYDLFKVVFADANVMLKEHFRCVAPIIEYSRREFYNNEIIPLRLPKLSERLDPPLVDVLVEDGVKTGDMNKREAAFIVDEIKKIVSDPTMSGRTIGVVSLLGNHQAKLVYERLEQEVGYEAMQAFNIACGDPRTFQGNERDIMFLSLVASRTEKAPLSRDAFAQRFNVAASRARDRMYLVRSVEANELSQADRFRLSLLQHFSSPFAQEPEHVNSLREKCESPFETDVYDLLTGKGYIVRPQVNVGMFRIDIVVEGEDDARLAIECDGDQFHGPDRWEADVRRQRILERAGWTFWRCFASHFRFHREEVVEDLIKTLENHRVFPANSLASTTSKHVEHRRYATVSDEVVRSGKVELEPTVFGADEEPEFRLT